MPATGADPNDVAPARATLDDLTAGPKATDLATALTVVKQAEAARDPARSKLDQATSSPSTSRRA